jgi:hypothetical protein
MSLTELALLVGRRPLPLGDVIGLTLTSTFNILFILLHVDSLLGSNRERSNYTVAVVK